MHEASDHLRAMVDAGTCTGAAAVLTDASRTIVLETFGTTRADDDGQGVPITEHTRFRWASCSKPITAVAALLAVQDGLLDLDAADPAVPPRASRFTRASTTTASRGSPSATS